MNINNEQLVFSELRKIMDSYFPLSTETWLTFQSFCYIEHLDKQSLLYPSGTVPEAFSFVYSGLLRSYTTDKQGTEYNKNFFKEGTFPGSMSALLMTKPSQFAIESLEASTVVNIDFASFRKLLLAKEDLKLFHIYYLEKNWLLAKDEREVQIVLENATKRYERFLAEHADIVSRIPQYHIASHLGITPTQLSRIRKSINT